MFNRLKGRAIHSPDYFLLAAFLLLTVFGLVMLSSASSDLGKIKFGDTYYYLRHQITFGLALGLLGFYLGNVISYRRYETISFFLLLASIGLLVLVFTPIGFSVGGAARWIKVGPLTVQPAEFVKLTYLLYLAAWLSNKAANRVKGFVEGFLPFAAISGLVALLLAMQPATSTAAVIVLSGLIVYWAGGAKYRYIGLFVFGALLGLAALIAVTPYRLERVKSFISGGDVQGSRYHIEQALITIGSGGLFGVGYGQSTSKYNYLPEPVGDSIFAVIAEEFGFMGASTLIAVFLAIVTRCFMLARKMTEPFGRLLLVGFASVIGIQAFTHIAAISGLIPLTGVPLPFISYGSTALVAFLTMAGIIVNITKSIQR
ncbi:MAG: hypothetical protein A2128_01465 [Candidatus Liptonbacteria bacterium GWC1_60_9]|uniref:Probable peptidoglycan glycosyltransferase FtsW n=2 Tax=Candidatus Liptoniibacteriota TaxID=1817909 RepID=A0A1G2C6H7_9BACT|nr:MAG: hypothetical protein A2128_01465 [Candidatus Liptonbacteria bacterium GWC1_60_9]